jgi:hypothetical protein
LVGLVPQIFILLGFLDKFAGLVVERVAFPGKLACGRIQFVPAVFVVFGLGKGFFTFFHQFVQHAVAERVRPIDETRLSERWNVERVSRGDITGTLIVIKEVLLLEKIPHAEGIRV